MKVECDPLILEKKYSEKWFTLSGERKEQKQLKTFFAVELIAPWFTFRWRYLHILLHFSYLECYYKAKKMGRDGDNQNSISYEIVRKVNERKSARPRKQIKPPQKEPENVPPFSTGRVFN